MVVTSCASLLTEPPAFRPVQARLDRLRMSAARMSRPRVTTRRFHVKRQVLDLPRCMVRT